MAKKDEAGVPAVVSNNKNNLPITTLEALNDFAFIDEHALDVVRENLGGQQMSPSDFDRIKFPAGGAQSWEVSGLDGDTESVKSIDGIVLMYKTNRSFWRDEFTGAGAPPDCQSKDLITGQGNPGGNCATCPYAQWNSDPKGGEGQACKISGTLFVMKPGEILPVIVPVPVASVKIVKKFMLGLSSKNIKFSNAVIGLGLSPAQNKKGIKYSEIKPRLISVLPDGAKTQIDAYIDAFRASMNAVTVAREDIPDA